MRTALILIVLLFSVLARAQLPGTYGCQVTSGGEWMKHNEQRILFTEQSVPYPQTCLGILRLCVNGFLSGRRDAVFPNCQQSGTPSINEQKREPSWSTVWRDAQALLPTISLPSYSLSNNWPAVAFFGVAVLFFAVTYQMYRMQRELRSLRGSPQTRENAPSQPEAEKAPEPEKPPQRPPEPAQDDMRNRLRETIFGAKEPPRPRDEEKPTETPKRTRGTIVSSNTYEI